MTHFSLDVATAGLLLALFAFSIVNTLKAERRHQQVLQHEAELVNLLVRIDALMLVWATHWGEPVDVLRGHLSSAINAKPFNRRKTDLESRS